VSTSDNDRIAYLSGEAVGSLTPHERAELDELRMLLETPATWEEPDTALEDSVVNAIVEEARNQPGGAAAPAVSDEASTRPARRRAASLRSRFGRPAFALGAFAAATVAAVIVCARR
jgi:hypothetical protein